MNANKKFKLNAVCLAVFSVLSASANAQNAVEDEKKIAEASAEQEQIEVIEVTGLRGSLIKSINDKRFSSNVVDSINAEDIGKSTDQNIADALGRITGVSIISRDGEGSQITVRGASANQNTISLNGQVLTSTDENQAVDLSSYSADILSKLEVVKTPSADHEEGSLGATVNLQTVRPLDLVEDRSAVNLQSRYNDLSEEDNYKFTLSGTKRFLDETLGVALSVTTETNDYRKDQFLIPDFRVNTLDIASDQDGNVHNFVNVIAPTGTNYQLVQNESSRHSGSLGIQFIPNDDTNIMFNATLSREDRQNNFDSINVRTAGGSNFIEGVAPSAFSAPPAPFSDPAATWNVFDSDTRTLLKKIGRYNVGDIARSQGAVVNDNQSYTFNIEHQITDDLSVDATLGYSSSTAENEPSFHTNMQNWQEVNNENLYDALENIQPVGFDCTQSQNRCEIIAGTHISDLGTDIGVDDNNDDNIIHTGFNPSDAKTFFLGSITENIRTVEDEVKSFKLDFDYEFDNFGITTIEFGGKVSSRIKDTNTRDFSYNANTTGDIVRDENGEVVAQPGGVLSDITAELIRDEGAFPVDDFMQSLGYASSNVTNNWTTLDIDKAINLVVGDPDLVRTPFEGGKRKSEIDTKAVYLKANFSLFDDKLTGDFGMRYVETELDNTASHAVTFRHFPLDARHAEYDFTQLSQLRDTSLPACPAASYGDAAPEPYQAKFERIDGTGWNTSSGQDPAGWTKIPLFDPNGDGVQDACHDPAYADWAVNDSQNSQYDWVAMWRYADISTTHTVGFDASAANATDVLTWNGEVTGQDNNYVWKNPADRSRAAIPASASHKYENWLPSLNLNYAIADDVIARFAASKTMTRPQIENTRANMTVNEMWATYWSPGSGPVSPGTIDMFNPKLNPLESENIDLSLEWYFNPSSLVSVAFFQKDMTNFIDIESTRAYAKDLRKLVGTTEGVDPTEQILVADDSKPNSGLEGCMPLRTTTASGFHRNDPFVLSNDYKDLCLPYQINKRINGDSAKIQGVELSYTQTYDFLPGFLSGLGLSANYTYQDSEYAAQQSTINPNVTLPSYPVAETPKHTYNATMFWEQDSHQIRLSYRGSSDSLVGTDTNTNLSGRTWRQGSLWNEGRDSIDLSIAYQVNENISINFQATNLTDEDYRTYFTSRTLDVQPVINETGDGFDYVALEEGNPLEGAAPKSRTYARYKVGRSYRLGVRVNF